MDTRIVCNDGEWAILHEGTTSRTVTSSSSTISVIHDLPADTEYYRHGWTSWSPTSWWHLDHNPWRVWNNPERTLTAEDAVTDSEELHRSYMVTCLNVGKDVSLLVGSLGHYSGLLTFLPGQICGTPLDQESTDHADTRECGESGRVSGWFLMIGPERECWDAYTEALARSTVDDAFRPPRPSSAVWSSWYSWFEEVTQRLIEDEIMPAARNGYDVIQIDDGWEKAVGWWEPNSDFPAGMSSLARSIRAAGMKPGLWIAPLIATRDAPIVSEHPEYFVHTRDGRLAIAGHNWGQPYFSLDVTHPGARRWLVEAITRINGWGYVHLKLDFLNAGAIEGVRHLDIPREVAYRTALQLIRSAAPHAFLLASGAVIAPSLGLVDSVRVGPDTAPYWDNTERHRDPSGPAMRNAMRNSLARFWLKSLVGIDPDVAYARTRGSLLSPQANAMTRYLSVICDDFSCSDPDAWLTDEERASLRQTCAEMGEGARRPTVIRESRYVFTIDGARVDFEPWINPRGRISDRLLIK